MKYKKDPVKIRVKLEKSRKLLLDAFNAYPENDWFRKSIVGEWSVNDILLHIIGWDELLLSQAKEWLEGHEPKDYNTMNENEYNRTYIENNPVKNKSVGIKKFEISTNNLIRFLNSLTAEQVKYALENESLIDLDLYSHDMEHYKQLTEVTK